MRGVERAAPYAQTGDQLVALKLDGQPPNLEPLVRLHLAPGLVALVEEALEPDPGRRTPRATELAIGLLPYSVG
ncbi:MAG: hypothetical protein R3F62_01220 [Planctomycetota bacterium]